MAKTVDGALGRQEPAGPASNPPDMRRLLPLLLLAALLPAVGLAAGPATAAPVPEGYTYAHEWFTSHDGLQLHAGVFLPEDHVEGEEHPVILVPTPYAAPNGGATGLGVTSTGPTVRFPELFSHEAFVEDRWAYVEVDVRGFGGSEGCFQYYMPNEAADVETAVEHIAGLGWAGDVALWGKSYDAAQHVLALSRDDVDGLAAAVIQAPGLSAYTALWQDGVHYATGRYLTTTVYTADDLFPSQNASTLTDPNYAAAALSPVTTAANYPTCRTDMLVGANTVADRGAGFWADKEPYLDAIGSDVPTFWVHGFYDANTKPVHMDVYSSLTGPTQAWFGQFTHVRGHEAGVGRGEYFLDEAFRFLDQHVLGRTPDVADAAVTVQQGDDSAWRHEAAWPPADGFTWAMPLQPGTYVDEPGSDVDGSAADAGILSTSPVLPHDVHLAGEVIIEAEVTATLPGAHLVALVYAVAPNGTARFVQRGATLVEVGGTSTQQVTLYPQDWEFREDERIAVVLAAGDDGWYSPGLTGQDVTVGAATATFPLLAIDREEFIEGGTSDGSDDVAPFTIDPAELAAAEVTVELPPEQRDPDDA